LRRDLALQRDRSYVRLRVRVEPEEDFHLFDQACFQTHWIPAFAGMTIFRAPVPAIVIPAKAGIQFQCLNSSSATLASRKPDLAVHYL
jgi:hypothetical protein